ncbi:hypothetical protein AB1N83_002216 [Pleurotus pulmonarius]
MLGFIVGDDAAQESSRIVEASNGSAKQQGKDSARYPVLESLARSIGGECVGGECVGYAPRRRRLRSKDQRQRASPQSANRAWTRRDLLGIGACDPSPTPTPKRFAADRACVASSGYASSGRSVLRVECVGLRLTLPLDWVVLRCGCVALTNAPLSSPKWQGTPVPRARARTQKNGDYAVH